VLPSARCLHKHVTLHCRSTLLYSRRVSTGLEGMSMAGLRPGMGRGPLDDATPPDELLQRQHMSVFKTLEADMSMPCSTNHSAPMQKSDKYKECWCGCYVHLCARGTTNCGSRYVINFDQGLGYISSSPAGDGCEAAAGIAPGASDRGAVGYRDRPCDALAGWLPQHRGVPVLLVHLRRKN